MTPLETLLHERISRDGPLSVAVFMDLCLAHPQYGYYRKKDPLGRGGDFITAPEISQMFGEVVGIWSVLTWQALGMPSSFALAEVGPGRGTLMADLLRASAALPGFREAASLHLVETSPVLRAVQKEALKSFRPVWHDTLETLPASPLLLVGNEFLDALPIRQFQKSDGIWRERLIDRTETNALAFTLGDAVSAPFSMSLARLAPSLDDGAILETCEAARSVIARVAKHLLHSGGAAVFIDYGPANSGAGDSLQAIKAHRYHPVLQDPGAADLTAHVDFETLRDEAVLRGLKAFGPVPQGEWLHTLGIAQRLEALMQGATTKQGKNLKEAYDRLTHPNRMGHLFKVLILASPDLG